MAVNAPSPWLFVRLKLRLLANGLRGRGVRIALFVLGALAAGAFAITGYAIFAIPGVADDDRAAALLLPLGGTVLVLGWLFLPLIFFGVDESLDPSRFALLPISRRTLIGGLLAAAVVGFPALSTLGATAGMVDTAARLGGAGAAVVELIGVVTGLLLCVAVSRAMTSAFASGLRSRRSRELAGLLLAVLTALLGPLQLGAFAAAQRADWDTMAAVAEVLGWTPLGAPYSVGLDVADGRLWAVPVKFLIVLISLGGLLRWWAATLEQAMLGAATASRGSTAARTGTPVDLLMFRGLPRTPFGALTAREMRYWWRETRRRTGLITVAVAGILVPIPLVMIGAGADGLAFMIGVLAAIGLANQFGYDGSAYATNVTAGVPGRLEIHSRAAAQAIFVLPVLVLTAIVVGSLSGEPGTIASRLGVLIATYGVGLGLVLPFSVRAAYALPESTNPFAMSSGGGLAKALPLAGVLLGTLILALPLYVAGFTLDSIWPWIGLPVGIAYGAAGYLIGSGAAGNMLDRRMPEVLAAVTAGRSA